MRGFPLTSLHFFIYENRFSAVDTASTPPLKDSLHTSFPLQFQPLARISPKIERNFTQDFSQTNPAAYATHPAKCKNSFNLFHRPFRPFLTRNQFLSLKRTAARQAFHNRILEPFRILENPPEPNESLKNPLKRRKEKVCRKVHRSPAQTVTRQRPVIAHF
ncbi:protein of unknown function [Trichlorobacter ammonificans]|uniref:Uncharacterized protein n=1 Tax=Trichlorobacter ammonificans TaxID=2916410 RepID=A0ABM9D8L3_9BACT|nr:protein of unknown function [Trichlorobacter ammonificans]